MKRTIEVSEETYQKIKEQLGNDSLLLDINCMEDMIGKKIFVRTVTYHLLGRVTKIVGGFVFLEEASWVADSGRFMQFVKDGAVKEVEPIGDWFFNISSVVDGCIWKHALPKEQK
jgi:hypothetical protein